ncbi:hypothetical protein [Paenibacillus arenosi]|uniref:hypothetical protein n=1 Tax=Paenibacillus arenosi TaxID=2774142 RepID=UPI002356DBC1|nr:hypothetical protein [Paenibacillus arenosi]
MYRIFIVEDDYITKPIPLDLLMAKIKGVLRRVYGEYADTSTLAPPDSELSAEGLRLNLSRNKTTWKQEKIVLTKNEQLLAECLMQPKQTYRMRRSRKSRGFIYEQTGKTKRSSSIYTGSVILFSNSARHYCTRRRTNGIRQSASK